MKSLALALLGIIAIALILFLIFRQPETQSEIKKTTQETKELGHDTVEGVKDAYDATKDAVHNVVK